MKRCKMCEVPKEYRRNYKKEAIDALEIAGSSFLFVAIFFLMVIIAI